MEEYSAGVCSGPSKTGDSRIAFSLNSGSPPEPRPDGLFGGPGCRFMLHRTRFGPSAIFPGSESGPPGRPFPPENRNLVFALAPFLVTCNRRASGIPSGALSGTTSVDFGWLRAEIPSIFATCRPSYPDSSRDLRSDFVHQNHELVLVARKGLGRHAMDLHKEILAVLHEAKELQCALC